MTEFEKRLLDTLDTINVELQNQGKAIQQMQQAMGELSDDSRRNYERLTEESNRNRQTHRESERRIKVLERLAFPEGVPQEAT